ncbi:MAG TPA: hypothetical protein P5268_08455 [Candidatus Marinimicrobia bacterium]|nr:hypothetical protein [Candidatus Neomarinimicrobiota bacterium]
MIPIEAAELSLQGNWLFKLGDDSTWSSPALNDSDWLPIRVPDYWENQGYENYDSLAWYRYHFRVDSTLLRQDSLILYLGKIDDADEAFLNGVCIGRSGAFPPETLSTKNTVRRYLFPAHLLKFDNLLAVRVYDEGEKGGIYSEPLKIVTIESPKTPLPSGKVLQNSINTIPFTNGIATCCYNLKTRTFTNFQPHIYRKFDEKSETPNLISQARVVLFRNQEEIPLTNLVTIEVGYLEGTGIVRHILGGDGFKLTIFGFCPFTLDKPFWIFYALLEGEKINELSLNFSFVSENFNLDIGKWAYQENDRKWLIVYIFYNPNASDAEQLFLRKYKNEHPGWQALIEEIDWWQNWQAKTLMPENIQDDDRKVYLQSLAVLKMAQCREPFPAGGQIIASLPPSTQNSCRPRDQAYAVEALLLSGHSEEARQALQFIMNGRCGRYKIYQRKNQNQGIGVDYAVSIYRYLGNGTEESISDENGLTTHLDNFGLTIWNIYRYVEVTEDLKFLKYYWPKISRYIADVLPTLIDADGLVRAEPGPWEKTLPFKHYTYTSACTYRGLLDAARLARQMNDENRAQFYEETAVNLRINVEKKLTDPQLKALKGNLEDSDPNLYADASAVEALNWIFNPQDQITQGTLELFKNYLTLASAQRGYCRTRQDLITNNQEWVFGDLRIISVLRKATRFEEAANLENWITRQALNNFGLLPQYFNIRNADYLGTMPRCGLGAGAYIINFW